MRSLFGRSQDALLARVLLGLLGKARTSLDGVVEVWTRVMDVGVAQS